MRMASKQRPITRWGVLLFCLLWVGMGGCPSRTKSVRKGPRFALMPVGTCSPLDSSQRKLVGSLCGREGKTCRAFRDHSTGLRFCMPASTTMQQLQFAPHEDPMSFEIRMVIPHTGIVLYLRRDPLLDDLPTGALGGRWLMRYAEAYIRRRGSQLREVKHKILSKKRNQFLHTTGGAWAAFPFAYGGRAYWEELLVLAREPGTRYLISIRMPDRIRQEKPQNLRRFLLLFLHQLRLGS